MEKNKGSKEKKNKGSKGSKGGSDDWNEAEQQQAWIPQRKGDTVEGVYKGFSTYPNPKSGQESKLHRIATEKDGTIPIFGSAQLDGKLGDVPEGSHVKLIYGGKKQLKNGHSLHEWRVLWKNDVPF